MYYTIINESFILKSSVKAFRKCYYYSLDYVDVMLKKLLKGHVSISQYITKYSSNIYIFPRIVHYLISLYEQVGLDFTEFTFTSLVYHTLKERVINQNCHKSEKVHTINILVYKLKYI